MSAWNEPDGQKAIGIKGPVEWEEGGCIRRVVCSEGDWGINYRAVDSSRWYVGHGLGDYEAACLQRDDARRWLEERGWDIRRDKEGY